jgi:hypothetical protein
MRDGGYICVDVERILVGWLFRERRGMVVRIRWARSFRFGKVGGVAERIVWDD